MYSNNDNVPNNNASTNYMENLKRLKKNLNVAVALMDNQVNLEDVIIFIGTTKAGKSTLINYLKDNPLIGRKDDQGGNMFNPLKIYKADRTEGPEIGCSPTSETTIPKRWVASQKFSELIMWDCPGFCDNRGPVQSITNAYYIYHLFQNSKSVKIVLVIDINDIIQDQINSFITTLSSVENILREKMRESFSSIGVIFTKVPETIDNQPVNINLIKEILRFQILSSSSINISAIARDFVSYLISNTQNIGIFKKATSGSITSDVDVGVFQAIQNTNSMRENTLKKVLFPNIDAESKIFLFGIREELSSTKTFGELVEVINGVFKDMLIEFLRVKRDNLSREKLFQKKEGLCALRNQLESNSDSCINLYIKIATLQMIDPKIQRKIESCKLIEKLKMMEFIDGLLDLKESYLCNLTLQSIMETVGSKISKLIVDMQCDLHEISANEAKAEAEKIQERYEQNINKINSEIVDTTEHNKDIEKDLGFFGKIGHSIDVIIKQAKSILSSL